MKKILTYLLIFGILASVHHVYALTPTTTQNASSSALPTDSGGILQEINNLKDRIASRVAQLNLVEKRGFIGTVTDIGTTQLTLNDLNNNIRYVDVDELTKFSSPSAKASFGISDITKGSILGILGRYNKDSKRTLGRFVDVLQLPQIISGAVSNIDSDNYILTVINGDQKEFSIDFENLTKTYVYTADGGIVKSGFSKIKQAERIMIIGFPDSNNKDKILASRVIRFPEQKQDPRIPSSKLQAQASGVTPSTGSGYKLTPLNGTKK